MCVFIYILKWECTAGGLQVYSAFRWVCRWVCPSHPSFMGEVCGVAGLWSVWCLSMQELLWQQHCFISLLYVCISVYLYIHLYTCISTPISKHRGTCLSLFKNKCTEVCICWVYTGFLGLEVNYVKNQWQRKQEVW